MKIQLEFHSHYQISHYNSHDSYIIKTTINVNLIQHCKYYHATNQIWRNIDNKIWKLGLISSPVKDGTVIYWLQGILVQQISMKHVYILGDSFFIVDKIKSVHNTSGNNFANAACDVGTLTGNIT